MFEILKVFVPISAMAVILVSVLYNSKITKQREQFCKEHHKETEEIKKRLLIDPHSPGLWRVNGILPNIDDFYEIFNISSENTLYIAPNDRVNIW